MVCSFLNKPITPKLVEKSMGSRKDLSYIGYLLLNKVEYFMK